MKTKKEDGKRKNRLAILIIGLLSIVLILTILAFSMQITSLQHLLTQANLTITNLTHSLAKANATVIDLNSKLIQAQITMAMQKAQITNLTNFLNLNESQVIFNNSILILPSISICIFSPNCQYPTVANITLHFNFAHAGYIVINTTNITGQNYTFLFLTQNYSRTWFGTNSSGVEGILNFSVRSITMPVLPGPATLKLSYYNTTNPTASYEARLTIIYHS
jgi:hypothetical protein